MSVNNRNYPRTAQVLNVHWSARVTFLKTRNRKRDPKQNIQRNTQTLWMVAENSMQGTWCRKEKVWMTPSKTPLLFSCVTNSHLQLRGTEPPSSSPNSNAHTTLNGSQCSINPERSCKFYYLSLTYAELLLPLTWSWLYSICYML